MRIAPVSFDSFRLLQVRFRQSSINCQELKNVQKS